jgi:hypothetical protein
MMLLATGSIVFLLVPQPWGGAALGVFTVLGFAELVAWFVLERRSRDESAS